MIPRDYVTEQLSIICGRPVNLTDAQVERCWALLTREEERHAVPDRHGNFPHSASALARLDLLEHPPLHADIRLLEAGNAAERWPNGHRFAVCLTHDVDRIVQRPWRERLRQIEILRGRVSPRSTLRWLAAAGLYRTQAMLGLSNMAPYDFWLEEEGKRGFRSTFFVLPEQLQQPTMHDHYYHYADAVRFAGESLTFAEASRRTAQQGWEIGLHGSYASAFNEDILRREKMALEAMLGKPVTAVRQHFLRFNIAITPQAHASAGFCADSTLGYSQTIGCRAGIAFPYYWAEVPDLLEVPLIIQDVGLLRNSRERTHPDRALARARALMRQIAEIGGVVTLSWHTHPDSPGAYPCYRALLDTIVELGGWGCSLGELATWWAARRTAVRQLQTRITS